MPTPQVTASPLTTNTSMPPGAEELADVAYLFIANWDVDVEVTTSWPGAIIGARTAAEKRNSIGERPLRTLRFTFKSTNSQETWAIKQILKRMGDSRTLLPLWSDKNYTTGMSASGGNSVVVNTVDRRFYTGARIIIAAYPTTGAEYPTFESAIVSEVGDYSIALTTNLINSYPLGSIVAPLLECDILPQYDAPKITLSGGKLKPSLLAREVPGISALPALVPMGGQLFYKSQLGYPVFDPGVNIFVEWLATGDGWDRPNRSGKIGKGQIFDLFGPRPKGHSPRSVRAFTRADAMNILRFFDSQRGPLQPFLAVGLIPTFKAIAITQYTVQIDTGGLNIDWEDYGFISVVLRVPGPQAAVIRPIASVSTSGGIDTITVSVPFWTTPAGAFQVGPTITYGTVSATNVSAPTTDYFVNGNSLPSGYYRATYISGSMSYEDDPSESASVGYDQWNVNLSYANYGFSITSGTTLYWMPGFGAPGPGLGCINQSQCFQASAGDWIGLDWAGGPMGVNFVDETGDYYDNVLGTPPPTWLLTGPPQIWFVSPAQLMRFESEDMNEKWKTTQRLELEFKLIELLNEENLAISGL